MPWQPPWMETGPHQSNNSHGSIQRRWQHFLEVHNQSAQSYCVITQKAEPWDLIWTSSAALSPVSAIQNQIKGQHFFCPSRREITIILNAEHFSIAWNLSPQTLCWPVVGKSCFLRVINVFFMPRCEDEDVHLTFSSKYFAAQMAYLQVWPLFIMPALTLQSAPLISNVNQSIVQLRLCSDRSRIANTNRTTGHFMTRMFLEDRDAIECKEETVLRFCEIAAGCGKTLRPDAARLEIYHKTQYNTTLWICNHPVSGCTVVEGRLPLLPDVCCLEFD